MKILVCIKQVPGSSNVEVDPVSGVLKRSGVPSKCNPYDLYAIEAALSLAERFGGSVECLTMGPPQAKAVIQEAICMGASGGTVLSDRKFAGADVLATAYTLSQGVRQCGEFDLIICGKQTTDGDTAQVGPQIAEKLEIPQVSYVADIEKDGDTLTVRRMLEDGYMTVQVQTPCLLTCIKELNTPRYMTIRGILDCDAEPVTVLDYNALKDDPLIEVDTIGLKGSPTNIYKSFTPPRKGSGMMLEGSGRETVERLFGILSAKHII